MRELKVGETTLLAVLNLVFWGWLLLISVVRWRVVAGTTLTTVRPWWLLAVVTGLITAIAELIHLPWIHRDYLYAALAITCVVPPIAVLGARRPTCRAWPMFVLLPLLVVLSWPVINVGFLTRFSKPLELETAPVLMYGLVIVMGFGNFVGTRLSFPALIAGAALLLLQISLSRLPGWDDEEITLYRHLSAMLIGVNASYSLWLSGIFSRADDGVNRVWQDFVTLYGLVWSRRLLDRFQILVDKHQWPCRLTANGIVWTAVPAPETQAAVEQALRWFLRRFVDADWIDKRLGHTASPPAVPPTALDM
ncbi:hypothetical protein GC163_01700 [bacterium]|nr:hypothetical protein [bacterium]